MRRCQSEHEAIPATKQKGRGTAGTCGEGTRSRRAKKKEENDDPGNDHRRGFRPLREDLLEQGRREAQAARVQGRDRLPRSQRGGPGLGTLRLGRGGLEELRLRPRGPPDYAGGRAQGEAPGRGARRPVRRLAVVPRRGRRPRTASSSVFRSGVLLGGTPLTCPEVRRVLCRGTA